MDVQPIRTLWVTNHTGSDDLRTAFRASPFGAHYVLDVRPATTTAHALSAAAEPDGTEPALIVFDWQGMLPPDAEHGGASGAPSAPIVLLVDDGLSDDAATSFLAGGVCEVAARSQVTPYWLDHLMRCVLRNSKPTTPTGEASQFEQEWMRAVADYLPAGVIVQDATSGRIVFTNAQSWAILGIEAADVETLAHGTPYGAFHPDGRPMDAADWPLEQVRATGKSVAEDSVHILRRDGERRILAILAGPVRDNKGDIFANVAVMRDVTERRRMEQNMAASDERLRQALAAGSMVAWTWDSRDDSLWQAGARQSDFESVSQGADSMRLIHPDDMQDYLRIAAEALQNNAPFTIDVRLLDTAEAEYRWHRVSGLPARDADGVVYGFHGITQDVHERVRARDERQAAEKRLRLALRAGGMAAWVWDARARVMWSSDNALQVFVRGAPKDLIDAFSGAPPDSRAPRLRELEALLTEQPGDYRAEFRVDISGAAGAEGPGPESTDRDESDAREPASNPYGAAAERWLETRATTEIDSSGAVRLVLGVTTDITARKQAELALAESEERLTMALEAGRMAAWEWDLTANHIWFSHTVSTIAGEMAADSFEALQALIHEDDWPSVEASLQQAITQRATFHAEFRMVHPIEHQIYWVEIRGSVKLDANGRTVALSGIVMDVTERKQAEMARRESEERLQLALEAGRMAAWDWAYDQDRFWYSNAMPAIVAPLPMPSLDLATAFSRPDDRARLRNLLLRAVDQRSPFHALHHTVHPETGGNLTLELRCSLRLDGSGRVIGLSGIVADVTERFEAEAALRRSEERYRLLVQATAITTWRIDAKTGRMIEPAPEWESYTGQRWEQYEAGGFVDAVHPEDRGRFAADWAHAFATGKTYETRARVWHLPTQEYRYIEARAVPLRDRDGRIREWIGANFDVEERVRAVRSTQERDQEMEALLDILPVGVFMASDASGKVIKGNRMAYAMLGLPPGSNLSLTPPPGELMPPYRAFIDGKEADGDNLPIQRAARLGEELLDVELEHHLADGRIITHLGNVRPLFDEAGSVRSVIAVFLSVTERKRLERSLAESRRRLETAAAAGGIGVFVWPGGEYAVWNQQACAHFGMETSAGETEVHLLPLFAYLWPEGNHDFGQPVESYCDPDGVFRQELALPADGGRMRWLRVVGKVAPPEPPLPARIIGVMYDVSETKTAALALVKIQEELELRVQERTRQLATALAQMQQEVEKYR